ncbi:chorismate synthase [Thermosulfidibacter takaii ABI70S6]|uniref:Chorismate synthase n=1 Tax=Thermosulfidibacter takaii (strain DSM 17441 / JCM 13301 / NBRC 103674 / ABI70S6) TaxID=1298851 RepID=A0A0S3QRJ6_THET7|nr:chorismate synthase [Thermosulfidibacter takaii]BAT70954.1 chorismate synthase [Thermosulfidibacter takaii ABI70S6]
MLCFYTAGESHGKVVLAFLEGIPSNLIVDLDFINSELVRRQMGYGRGGRMKIERDKVEVLSGVYRGKTTGAPIVLAVWNRDWENWKEVMDPFQYTREKFFFVPRPGHADLPALLKYQYDEMRPAIERSSARETAGRVAAGAVCKLLLKEFGVEIASATLSIGKVRVGKEFTFEELKRADESPVRCPDDLVTGKMMGEIDKAKSNGDTVGGVFEVRARGVVPGLGSHVQWDLRLDGLLAQAMMSIQGIKSVSIGCGWDCWDRYGTEFHDEIVWQNGVKRKTNNAGGIEGGISNGEEIVVRCFMKPIPTLMKPLGSFDIRTKEKVQAGVERSDACAVPAAAIVAEAMMAFVLAKAYSDKFGGDSLQDMKASYEKYVARLKAF